MDLEAMTARNNPPRWIIQLPGGPALMANLITVVEQIRAEAASGGPRRECLDRLLTGCQHAKHIGTGGTDGTD